MVFSNFVGKSPELGAGGNLGTWRGEGGEEVVDEKGGVYRYRTRGGSVKGKKF